MKGIWEEICRNGFKQLKTVYLVTIYVFFEGEKKVANDWVESGKEWRTGYFIRRACTLVEPGLTTPSLHCSLQSSVEEFTRDGEFPRTLSFSYAAPFQQMPMLPCNLERCCKSQSTDFRISTLFKQWTVNFCSENDTSNPSSHPQPPTLRRRWRHLVIVTAAAGRVGMPCTAVVLTSSKRTSVDPSVDPYGGDIQPWLATFWH